MADMEIYRDAYSRITAALALTDEELALANTLGGEGALQRERKALFQAVMGGLARRVIRLAANEVEFQDSEWLDEAATETAIAKLHDINAINEMVFIFEHGRLNTHAGVIRTQMTDELRARIRQFEPEL